MVGTTVSHYQILSKLGEGGMGVVYKALDLTLDRTVAIKLLTPALSCSPDYKSRFLHEARAASALDHPNICTIFEANQTDGGQMFLVMAYYEGVTLQQRIDCGRLPLDEAISIAAQMALGLQAAHQKGIVHRDIKSANIMLAQGNRVKIMDFGLAKSSGRSQLTGATVQLGTVASMSPEQARGTEVDHRTDIWSLGVVLYQMVTGRLPFQSEYDQALIYAILNETPELPHLLRPEIPRQLESIILRCLERAPAQRYQSAGDLADDLLKVGSRNPALPHRRKTVRTGLWLVLIALTMLLAGILLREGRKLVWSPPVKENAVVVQVGGSGREGNENEDITPEMLDFLITDELLQSTNKEILHREEFLRLNPSSAAALAVNVTVSPQAVGYLIKIDTERPNGETAGDEAHILLRDRCALLTQALPEIRRRLALAGVLGDWKQSTFTNNCDAFVKFFKGCRAWTRFEIPKAKEYLSSALNIDPHFALARLRLAEVQNFDGSARVARLLLQEVRPAIGQMSRIDSLCAEALAAQIARDYRTEVAIRRAIYDAYPLRKECAYDVAEAYFNLCEIPDAMTFYKRALEIDPRFSRAYNHLGYCYSHLGQHDSALAAIRTYVKLDSTANTYDSMGDCYLAAGYLDSAVAAKERGIAIDPQLSYLYGALVYIRLRQGRLDDADSAADGFLQNVYTLELKAVGLTQKAFVAYERRDYGATRRLCRQALQTFDSQELEARNPELHWLNGLVSLRLNDVATAVKEVTEMGRLLQEHRINATNYQMSFYKYYHHLYACLSARKNEIATIMRTVDELDGQIRSRVKDHTSPFDYAFLSTSLGELLMQPPLNRSDLAVQRFNHALEYNPRYAPAHYYLWKVYTRQGESIKAAEEFRTVRRLWKDADSTFKNLYNLPPDI